MKPLFSLRSATATDARWIAELRAVVLKTDLERLGRYDPMRVRQRFLDGFDADHTQVIMVDGETAGSIAVRPDLGSQWIEHFYLDPGQQGKGLGGAVLTLVMRNAADSRPFRLNVLTGSPAQRLYLRHGFSVESQDAVDVFMVADGTCP
ncbi:Ribosomal protein S18 acetylase RimI [Arthrobacter alpinus]|uniref:Ribosomal protein S18 acetylase RimI n=1 Tax=Arthrobacter alpinus TaxID=656366 RepID=A0A1H5DQ70_9MICC|nr:GNAT family N-acetyltransferase [Arthrobacter alpinus]SED80916.1 Ribosomal protein S18 acetylase RimI [Arthrobacter alpinus]